MGARLNLAGGKYIKDRSPRQNFAISRNQYHCDVCIPFFDISSAASPRIVCGARGGAGAISDTGHSAETVAIEATFPSVQWDVPCGNRQLIIASRFGNTA